MADTQFIKNEIEPYMCEWLRTHYPNSRFKERLVHLVDGSFKFDAVSEDESVVALFMCNRPRTSSGNENSGAVKKALNDIHYLQLLPRPKTVRRLVVFTDAGFRDLILRRSKRLGTNGIDFHYCQLPSGLQKRLNEILDACRREQRSKTILGIETRSGISPTNRAELPIKLFPPNLKEFRETVLRSGSATIKVYFIDGRSENMTWKISRLSPTSNIIGNLRSRPKFRSREWQRYGIVRIEVTVN